MQAKALHQVSSGKGADSMCSIAAGTKESWQPTKSARGINVRRDKKIAIYKNSKYRKGTH